MQIGIDFYYSGDTSVNGVAAVTMKNNIITNCSLYGLRVGSFNVNDVTGDYNLWYGNANDVYWNGTNKTLATYKTQSPYNEAHSISANPSCVSASTGNYRLNAGSPAIDKGTTISKVANDMDYAARPKGLAYDIGAYESY